MKQKDTLYALLNESAETYESFIKIEYEKYDAVARDDIKKLDEIIETEQVFYMKMKGQEQKRNKLVQNMGFEDKTLKEIIEIIKIEENDENHEFKKVYDRLFKALNDFKKINSECKTLIEVRLHRIENVMIELGKKENREYIYTNADNKKDYFKNHIVSKKI